MAIWKIQPVIELHATGLKVGEVMANTIKATYHNRLAMHVGKHIANGKIDFVNNTIVTYI